MTTQTTTTTRIRDATATQKGQTAVADVVRGKLHKSHDAAKINDAPPPSTLPPLPDPPRKKDMLQSLNFVLAGIMHIIGCYYRALRFDDNVLVAGEAYICATRRDVTHAPHPDLLIAFGVDAAAIAPTNGYVIDEVGKPPDFVLEVASSSTARRDYTVKREIYARLGIPEYWRFDYTGGRLHDAPLAGDRLVDDAYVRIPTERDEQGRVWGYSAVLGLWLCWDNGRLRFHDGIHFLEDLEELSASRDAERMARDAERTARLTAEVQRDAAQQLHDAERTARLTAEVQRDGVRDERDAARQERDAAQDERAAAERERDQERQARLSAEQERDDLRAELRRLRNTGQGQ